MREGQDKEQYTLRFLKFSEAVEKRLLKGIVVFFVLLLLVQALLLQDGIRTRISIVDRLEGVRFHFAPS